MGIVGLNDAMPLADYRSVAKTFPEMAVEEARSLGRQAVVDVSEMETTSFDGLIGQAPG